MPRAPELTRVSDRTSPRTRVVAGILRDRDSRVLLTERTNDRDFAGLWEFPGGKVDGNETSGQALCRELREELGVGIGGCEPFLTVEHDYPGRRVRIEFFLITDWRGEIRGMLGQRLRWVPAEALAAVELLPANAAVAEKLRSDTG